MPQLPDGSRFLKTIRRGGRLMRRHNQRLHRAARAILRNDSESEDVMQEAYVRAAAFRSTFSTACASLARVAGCSRAPLRKRSTACWDTPDSRMSRRSEIRFALSINPAWAARVLVLWLPDIQLVRGLTSGGKGMQPG
jgi:hypothetical protein